MDTIRFKPWLKAVGTVILFPVVALITLYALVVFYLAAPYVLWGMVFAGAVWLVRTTIYCDE